MKAVKTEKILFVLFLCVAVICLSLAAGLLINSGCKKHDPVYYTVTFDTNGGSEIEAKEVEAGTAVAKPEDPTREGYKFNGWVKLDNTEYNFADPVNENLKLFAKWTIDEPVTPSTTYKVTFYVDGYEFESSNVEKNGTVQKPETDPTAEGKEFDKWIISDGTAFDFTTKIDSDLNLYALWKGDSPSTPVTPPAPPSDVQYTVTFNTDGGSPVLKQAVQSGKKAVEPEDTTKAGYEFDGWFTSDGKAYNFNTPVTKDLTLTAHWTKRCTVTFDSNGGSEVPAQYQKAGEKAVNMTPTRSGYTFDGWYTESDTEFDFNTALTGDIKLTAKWTKDDNGTTEPTTTISWQTAQANFADSKLSSYNGSGSKTQAEIEVGRFTFGIGVYFASDNINTQGKPKVIKFTLNGSDNLNSISFNFVGASSDKKTKVELYKEGVEEPIWSAEATKEQQSVTIGYNTSTNTAGEITLPAGTYYLGTSDAEGYKGGARISNLKIAEGTSNSTNTNTAVAATAEPKIIKKEII